MSKSKTRKLLKHAQRYIDKGFGVIPLDGKKPLIANWREHPIRDAVAFRKYLGSANGVGIVIPDGIVVLDLDVKAEVDGHRTISAMVPEGMPWPPKTIIARTGRNGSHLWFRKAPEDQERHRGVDVAPGVDLLVNGYVVAPPSAGAVDAVQAYRWESPLLPLKELPVLPEFIRSLWQRPKSHALVLAAQNDVGLREKDDEQSIIITAADANTDLWATDILKTTMLSRWRHARGVGWFEWTGTHWSVDEDGAKFRMEIGTHCRERAKACTDVPEQRYWRGRLNQGGLVSLSKMLQDRAEFRIGAEKLDANPALLTCEAGTIDLRSGELGPFESSDYITHFIPYRYDDAPPVLWLNTLEGILPNHRIRDNLQRVLGYCCTGEVREQCMWIFVGRGRNGKSTVLGMVQRLLGGYARPVSIAALLAKGDAEGRPSPELVELRGRRLAIVSEIPHDIALDEARVKRIVGSSEITARSLYVAPVTWHPEHKIIMETNSLPRIAGQDEGIWRGSGSHAAQLRPV